MARRAVADHGADWVISSDADEFWWPRGESLTDVLAVIPDRYQVVQALVREFRPGPGDGEFAERLTIRPSLEVAASARADASRAGAASRLSRIPGAHDRAGRRDRERSPRSAPRVVPDRGPPVSLSQQGAGRASVFGRWTTRTSRARRPKRNCLPRVATGRSLRHMRSSVATRTQLRSVSPRGRWSRTSGSETR